MTEGTTTGDEGEALTDEEWHAYAEAAGFEHGPCSVCDAAPARCAGCGMGPHRYSTADPHHAYDAMACVNMLRAEVLRLRRALFDLGAEVPQ